MRIVFISDIHANWNYLAQVIPLLEKDDKIFFLGDSIGYYDEPDKVVTWLNSVNAQCIKGNHEEYLLGELDYDDKYEDIYKVKKSKEEVSAENITFIETWPNKLEFEIAGKRFLMVHGEEDNSEKYMYNSSDLDSNILKKYDYYVYGHTHIPLIHYYYGCCVINPGSIGQPRDYTAEPSFAVVDLETFEVTIKKISVDIKTYNQYLKANGYDEKVINILTRTNT